MSLAQDIMDAVKKGGSEKWRPQCEKNQHSAYEKRPNKTQEKDKNMLIVMGNKQWTVALLARKLGIPDRACRDALDKQMKKGTVKRSAASQPYHYFKA